MIKIFGVLVMFLIPFTLSAQLDTCFTKEEIIILDYKIQNLLTTMDMQDSLMIEYEMQLRRYEMLVSSNLIKINLLEEKINALEDMNVILQEKCRILEPKWYENKYLYFVGGMAFAIGLGSAF